MKLIKVVKSSNPKKKYDAIFEKDNGKEKKVSFGAAGFSDYTITNDDKKKAAYQKRHAKDLNTNDATRAGYLSMFLLWNKPTLEESIKDYKQKFSL